MSKKLKTHVGIVLDRSGSMGSIKQQAIDHYNEQVDMAQNNSKDQDITLTLVTFNENVFEHHVLEPIDSVAKADADSYRPSGGTALWDGVGYTIKKMQEATEGDDEASYLLIVISDGEENQSKHYNSSNVKEMIDSCQATGRWTVSYVGCDARYLHQIHEATNIPLSNMAVWSNANAAIAHKSLRRSSERVGAYYTCRGRGVSSTSNLMNDANDVVADFTDIDVDAGGIDPMQSMSPPGMITGGLVDQQGWTQNIDNLNVYKSSITAPTPVTPIKEPFANMQNSVDMTARPSFNKGTAVTWSK